MESGATKPRRSGLRLPESAEASLAVLVGIPEIERVILFGSRAVGDHDERSDIDVAVSAPRLGRAGLAALRDRLDRSRTLYKISVTPIESMPPDLSV